MAEEMKENGIEELADDVTGWGRGGILEMDILEQTPTTYFFNVTWLLNHLSNRQKGASHDITS